MENSIDDRISPEKWRIVVFRRRVLKWFNREGRSFPWRKPSASRYARVVSEILLQRTRAETVAQFMPRFLARFPGWESLASAKDADMRIFLEPIGLWRRRAASLRALGREMKNRNGRFPISRAEIETLPGVGQYVASAVMLFCHGMRESLLDVNMARVLERYFGSRDLADIRYDPWLQALARRVVDHEQAVKINWAALDLASKVCIVREPRCDCCPLQRGCRFFLDKATWNGTKNIAARKELRFLSVPRHKRTKL